MFSFVLVVLLVAVAHSFFHFYFFGTGIQGFRETGISGLSIGNTDVGEEATGEFSLGVSFSQIFIIVEWILLFFLLIFSYARGKTALNKEINDLRSLKSLKGGANKTDIDKLYEMLQERKRISFSAIANAFEINLSVVRSWAETLETGKLAEIDYPRVGEPEIVLKNKEVS